MRKFLSIVPLLIVIIPSLLYGQAWEETNKLVASDRDISNHFGNSVAISNNYAIVGAVIESEDQNNENTIENAGAAYVYKRNDSGAWIEVQKLVPSDRGIKNYFGGSVSISGNLALIGASHNSTDENIDNIMQYSGAAYIFERDSSGLWQEKQKIVASDRSESDVFGLAVSISGNYAIVGSYLGDYNEFGEDQISAAGAAYIFEKNNSGVWEEVQKVVASNRMELALFGFAVDISGEVALVSAHRETVVDTEENIQNFAGAAYTFERNDAGIWTETQRLVASDRNANDKFGSNLSISGNYALIGAYGVDEDASGLNTLSDAGAAYVFERSDSSDWIEVQKIVASDRNEDDDFGFYVDISDNYALIGAWKANVITTNEDTLKDAGAAYMFERQNTGVWSETKKIIASDSEPTDFFGTSIAISGHLAIIGAFAEDENAVGEDSLYNSGAAYIFELLCSSDSSIQYSQTIASCNSALVNGNIYTSSQIIVDTIVSETYTNCDTVVITDLIIHPSYYSTIDTILQAGESISVGPNIYTTNGSYIDSLSTINGCDSIIHTTIEVLTGANDLISNQEKNEIKLFPVPAQEVLNIVSENNLTRIKIYDVSGRLRRQLEVTNKKSSFPIVELDPGIYFLEAIQTNGFIMRKSFIKQ